MDMERVRASVCFDVRAQRAEVMAEAEFRVDGPDGWPVFDLRQDLVHAELDGRALSPGSLPHRDLGAGQEARARALEVMCPGGSRHNLALRYELGTPDATGSVPLGWSPEGDGVAWDLWMSDLEPGRYLEMWLPAGLCHDRLALELDIQVNGSDRPHCLVANGQVTELESGAHWHVRYPSTFTSLSPLLVLAPADQLAWCQAVVGHGSNLAVTVVSQAGAVRDLDAVCADTCAWLAGFDRRYGTWAHGGRFLAVMWDAPRGMEYDGATTACERALEHEIFHSWFGRGVKPASANDGWMDEAMASWATTSRGEPRWAADELGLDHEPALLCPAHPWARSTPREAYTVGRALLSGVAAMMGGAASMRSALAAWHGSYGGGLASTEDLERHLSSWCGRDLSPWWDRYVYGGEARRPST